jgi:hypothetical protein
MSDYEKELPNISRALISGEMTTLAKNYARKNWKILRNMAKLRENEREKQLEEGPKKRIPKRKDKERESRDRKRKNKMEVNQNHMKEEKEEKTRWKERKGKERYYQEK